jgi:hypothetical protein
MTEQIYQGQCFCGEVQFSVSGPVQNACFCHCQSCRSASGAPFVAWGSFPRRSLAFAHGTLTTYQSSEPVIRGFCGQCGTTISYQHNARPDQIDVSLVILDPKNRPKPEAHIWLSEKESSIQIGDDLPRFSEWRHQ